MIAARPCDDCQQVDVATYGHRYGCRELNGGLNPPRPTAGNWRPRILHAAVHGVQAEHEAQVERERESKDVWYARVLDHIGGGECYSVQIAEHFDIGLSRAQATLRRLEDTGELKSELRPGLTLRGLGRRFYKRIL